MQQRQPLTLRRNFSWTFTGNLVLAACQWAMVVVLAKIGSPEMIGQFTLGLAVTTPVFMFTNLSLRSVQVTDAKKQYLLGDYLGLRLISTGLALLIIVIISWKAGYPLETSLIILLSGLTRAFDSISDIFYGLIQQHERMDRIAVSMMIKGPLSVLLLGIGVYISGNIVWGAVGVMVASAVVLVSYDLRSSLWVLKIPHRPHEVSEGYELAPRWHLRSLTKLVWLALPMGLVMLLRSLNINIPRYLVERYFGARELGIFVAIASLMVAGNTVVFALADSAIPKLAKYYAAGNGTAFRTLLFKLAGMALLLGGIGVLVAVVAGGEILTILYQPEYAQYKDLFVWFMVAATFNYVSYLLGDGMTAARYFRLQIPLFASVTTISAIACLWLLPIFGIRGGAIALIIAETVRACFSLAVIIYALHRLPRPEERSEQS